jgi:hypothetical protein
MNNNYLRLGLFTILLVFLNSCDANNDSLIIEIDKETFEKERILWNSQNIENYQFVYEFFNDAGPGGPIRITINEKEGPVIENKDQDVLFKTISEIYDFLSRTFDFIESVENGTYDGYKIKILTLNITYNGEYHYPQQLDYSEGYVEAIDGGGYYRLKINEFKLSN